MNNAHQNARTTPYNREVMVSRAMARETAASVAEDFAVSVRTVRKWTRRFRQEGRSGLLNRSSAPRCVPRRLPAAWVEKIVRLRVEHQMTGAAIAESFKLPRSTVAGVLTRRGLGSLKTVLGRRPVVRYEKKRPGDLLHVDIKKLGRFRVPGHRVTGDRAIHSKGLGFEYAHVAVDDFTRLAYVELLPDETQQSACAFVERALVWFRQQGVSVKALMTDNGPCYRAHQLASLCRKHRLRHIRTRPYTPQTNGKAERFIQTMLRKWAYYRPYRSSEHRARHLPRWLITYNFHRPHGSLGGKPPASRLRSG